MKKRAILFLVLISFLVVFLLISSFFSFNLPFLHGKVSVSLNSGVELILDINIHSPENTTYFFDDYHANNSYRLPLNVSSQYNLDTWWYRLIDLDNNVVVFNKVIFTPNTTFDAVRGSNKLIVSVNDSSGRTSNESVIFSVNVGNTAPIIVNLSDEIYVCEGDHLSYEFNVTDVDEDVLVSDISPKDPFYIYPSSKEAVNQTAIFEIFSGVLDKEDIGGVGSSYKIYQEIVSMDDQYNSTCCVDTKNINITVIEINNAPKIENIGVKTLYTVGDNSSFYKEVNVSDVEDGNRTSDNLTFSVEFLQGDRLFNISDEGVINFTVKNDTSLGVYLVRVCVNDSGILNPHQNISNYCGQDGSSIQSCDNFSLTITDDNRPPTIKEYYPENLSLNISGTDSTYFNITNYDPDGTIPDTYWYVDDSLEKYDSGNSTSNFTNSFGCGVSGVHTVKVEITDGLENDSLEWAFNVDLVRCPSRPSGGGGGTFFGERCQEKWGCGEWSTCQSLNESLKQGILSRSDYREVKLSCEANGWEGIYCGYQIRDCEDVNNCNTTWDRPPLFKSCFYVTEPNCHDGIKNCHNGSCELLADCGGPCRPCSTCSDGIKNQGEKGIDCGGPCPPCPAKEKPITLEEKVSYVLWIATFVVLGSLVYILIRLFKSKKEIKMHKKCKKKNAKKK